MEKNFFVYMLLCEENKIYTGYTVDMSARYQSHLQGTGGCKFTKSFKPLCILQCWQINADKASAMKVERYIKKLSRVEKNYLVQNPDTLIQVFADVSMQKSTVS